MFEFLHNKVRKEIPDLNVVPILDMLISVIFFLILTTTFLQLTKESVPPSSVSTITDPVRPPPLAAKLVGAEGDGTTRLIMSWTGAKPGQLKKEVDTKDATSDDTREAVLKAAQEMAEEFSAKFPDEKTLQLGLARGVSYQKLMAIMDGVKEKLPDIVLFDYQEAEIRAKKGFE